MVKQGKRLSRISDSVLLREYSIRAIVSNYKDLNTVCPWIIFCEEKDNVNKLNCYSKCFSLNRVCQVNLIVYIDISYNSTDFIWSR